MNAEDTRLIAGCGNDAVLVRIAADDNGFPTPIRMVELFDRCEERIQIHEQDGFAYPRCFTWYVRGKLHQASSPYTNICSYSITFDLVFESRFFVFSVMRVCLALHVVAAAAAMLYEHLDVEILHSEQCVFVVLHSRVLEISIP